MLTVIVWWCSIVVVVVCSYSMVVVVVCMFSMVVVVLYLQEVPGTGYAVCVSHLEGGGVSAGFHWLVGGCSVSADGGVCSRPLHHPRAQRGGGRGGV